MIDQILLISGIILLLVAAVVILFAPAIIADGKGHSNGFTVYAHVTNTIQYCDHSQPETQDHIHFHVKNDVCSRWCSFTK